MLLQKMEMSTGARGERPGVPSPALPVGPARGAQYLSSPHLCGSSASQDDYLSLPAWSPLPQQTQDRTWPLLPVHQSCPQ